MKKFVIFLIVMTCVCMSFVTAFADPTTEVGSGVASATTTATPSTSADETLSTNSDYYDYTQNLDVPKVTTKDLENRINQKGNDIIRIVQVVGRIICIIGFVICCILAIIGICGNKQLLTGALIGLVICGFAYAGITCGREIVEYIAAWAAS